MKFLRVTLLIFLLAVHSFCFGSSRKSEEIVIRLQAPNQLVQFYMENIRHESSMISEAHAQELQSILLFDLNNNGKLRTLEHSEIGELKKNATVSELRSKGVSYQLSTWIRDQFMTFSVLSTAQDKICFAEDIKLTGDLGKDRVRIHEVMSHLHQFLFDEPGIYLSKILYTFKTRNVSDPYYSSVPEEIYQCDFDGGNSKQMTFENSHCITPHPVLAKNGKDVEGFFYVSYKIGQPKIFWTKFDNPSPQRLCYIPGNQFMPCLSAKGDKVVFINDAPGHPEIFLQDFKPGVGSVGKPRQIYSCRRGVQASPVFSPDGNKIAFVSDQSGSPRIYVMDIPPLGSSASDIKPILITKQNRENTKPSWSLDGTKLAYIARVDDVRQVWIYDFITNQEWQLTQGGVNKENPQWANNNLHLLFNSVGNDSCELYLVNLHQPKAVRIKTLPGIKRFPAWINKAI